MTPADIRRQVVVEELDLSIDGRASESWTIEKIKINPGVKASVFQKKP